MKLRPKIVIVPDFSLLMTQCPVQLESALMTVSARTDVAHCFVIGGGQVYKEALALPQSKTAEHVLIVCSRFLMAQMSGAAA